MTSEFEIFSDPLHYDMWCLRRKSDRDFNMTLHFNTKNQAEHARAVIQEWVKAELEACAKFVLAALDANIKTLVEAAVQAERKPNYVEVGQVVQAFGDLTAVEIPNMPPVGTKLYVDANDMSGKRDDILSKNRHIGDPK